MVLDLDEEVVPPEDVLEFRRCGDRRLEVARRPLVAFLRDEIGPEQLRDETTETSGRGDHPLGVSGEEIEVHPRLVVVALEEGLGGELEEVAIPGLALR